MAATRLAGGRLFRRDHLAEHLDGIVRHVLQAANGRGEATCPQLDPLGAELRLIEPVVERRAGHTGFLGRRRVVLRGKKREERAVLYVGETVIQIGDRLVGFVEFVLYKQFFVLGHLGTSLDTLDTFGHFQGVSFGSLITRAGGLRGGCRR